MTAPRPTRQPRPSRTLSLLFGVALLGLLVAGGLLAASLGGLPLLLGYAAVVSLLLGLGVLQVRRVLVAGAPPPPPHCSCCDGDHTKPVTVL